MSDDTPAFDVINNEAEGRFEATIDGHLAVAQYMRGDGSIMFTHTEVPEALSGRGVAQKLVKTALDYARDQQLEVIPFCPFVAGYIKRHPEYRELVPPEFRGRVE